MPNLATKKYKDSEWICPIFFNCHSQTVSAQTSNIADFFNLLACLLIEFRSQLTVNKWLSNNENRDKTKPINQGR